MNKRLAILPLLPLALLLVAADTKPSADDLLQGDWAKIKGITPRTYACARARTPITIDGKGDDPAWAAAPWTSDFVDIEGDKRPAPRFRTRAKLLWDDQNLYIFAELQEPHVWGTLTQKNAIMFIDNDFELFINPTASNHNYYEFEMNALNSIWELTLDKPYRDGGPAHLGDNIEGLKSAVHIDGTLNNPADTDHGWSVEIAIPWKGLARYANAEAGPAIQPSGPQTTDARVTVGPTAHTSCPPRIGDQWRMNFSRVEWLVDIIDGKYRKIPKEMRAEDNWIWSPQGVIDMHRPERWGLVQFCDSAEGVVVHPDPSLPTRDALMEVYYRQREFRTRMNRYANSFADMGMNAAENSIPGKAMKLESTPEGYIATSSFSDAEGKEHLLHIRQDSLIFEGK